MKTKVTLEQMHKDCADKEDELNRYKESGNEQAATRCEHELKQLYLKRRRMRKKL